MRTESRRGDADSGRRCATRIGGVGARTSVESSPQATDNTIIAVNARATALTARLYSVLAVGGSDTTRLLSHLSDRHSSGSVYHDPIFGLPTEKFANQYALAYHLRQLEA